MQNLVVYVSGGGTNLQAIIDAIESGKIKAQISLVVSNKESVYGLERAAKHGIPTLVKTLKSVKAQGRSRIDYDMELAEAVIQKVGQPTLQVLAGFMHILSPEFIDRFIGPIINLHPALPGQYDGVNAISRAYADFKAGSISHTGVMVHKVIPAVDKGEVILKENVEIFETDKLADLESRMHAKEHEILVNAILVMLQ
jgi:formyltetrahydrofolate-dependent phosphoribosylglycinamide formyltransferase